MFPFIKNSKLWFTISGVLVTLSLIAIATLGLRLGIDFTGGSLLEISGLQEVENEQIAEQVALLGEEFESPVIQKTSEETVLIRTKFLTPELHDEVFNNL
ncbi:MAG: protein translocase subunit SecF, partial [Patescibacteria group bacterium]|nr:protein translocase subunit SecF [Patescibacteria group bacterium]